MIFEQLLLNCDPLGCLFFLIDIFQIFGLFLEIFQGQCFVLEQLSASSNIENPNFFVDVVLITIDCDSFVGILIFIFFLLQLIQQL